MECISIEEKNNLFNSINKLKLSRKNRKLFENSFVYVHEDGFSNNKEIIASVIEDFFNEINYIPNGSYLDEQSRNMKHFLADRLPQFDDWVQNSSQKPFDLFSIKAMVAIENKSQKVVANKIGVYNNHEKVIANATLYPNKVKVKDVISKKDLDKYSDDVLNSYMDVLVTFVDKDSKTNNMVRYAIVDGSYWKHTYEVYKGCSKFFNVINNFNIKLEVMNYIKEIIKDKDVRSFIDFVLQDEKHINQFGLRKILMVDNPTMEC